MDLSVDLGPVALGRVNLRATPGVPRYHFQRTTGYTVQNWALPQCNDGPVWPGNTYSWYVTPVGADGIEGEPSAVRSVTIPEPVPARGGTLVGVWVEFVGEDRATAAPDPGGYTDAKALAGLRQIAEYFRVESHGLCLLDPIEVYPVTLRERVKYMPDGYNRADLLLADVIAALPQVAWGSLHRLIIDALGWNGAEGGASIPGNPTATVGTSWIFGPTSVTLHELGHSYGMGHAGSLTPPFPADLSVPLPINTYGDVYCVMGSTYGYGTHFCASCRRRAGWSSHAQEMIAAQQTDYLLPPLEVGTDIQALVIPLDANGACYVLEYRLHDRRFGPPYDDLPGVQLRLRCGVDNRPSVQTVLPLATVFSDPRLAVRQEWTDPAHGVRLVVRDMSERGAVIRVGPDPVPPVVVPLDVRIKNPKPGRVHHNTAVTLQADVENAEGTVEAVWAVSAGSLSGDVWKTPRKKNVACVVQVTAADATGREAEASVTVQTA